MPDYTLNPIQPRADKQLSWGDQLIETLYHQGIARPGTYQYSNWSPQLESYMAELYKTYGNTPFWEELMANPYLMLDERSLQGQGIDYLKNLYLENLPLAMSHIGNILQRAHNQAYDDPMAQINRLRKAGINGDISGDVSSGPSADQVGSPSPDGITNPLEGAMMKQGVAESKQSVAESIASMGMNAASTILSLVAGAASINGQNINNALGSVAAIDQTTELFYNRLIDASPVPSFKADMSVDERNAAFKQALQTGFNQMNWNGIDRRSKKFFTSGFQNWMEGKADTFGFEKRIMKAYNDYAGDRSGLVEKVGSPLYKDNIDEMIGNFTDVIGDLSLKVQTIELEYRKALAELGKVKANIDTQAYEGAAKDPNYIPNITETILGSPSVTKADQNATIAEAGARIESANTLSQEETIEREQKKAVMLIGKAFDKAIEKVDKSPRFRSLKPYVRGTLKMMKSGTMSVVDKWLDKPSLPPVTGPAAARKSLGGAMGLIKGAM